jgi:hypothetical protein
MPFPPLPFLTVEKLQSFIFESARLCERMQEVIDFVEEHFEVAKDDDEKAILFGYLLELKKCLWWTSNAQCDLGFFFFEHVGEKFMHEKIKIICDNDVKFQKLALTIWMHFQE